MQAVKDFLPDTFIFTKRFCDQPIPVANGQEDVVTLEKCLVKDNDTFGLYTEETGKRSLPSVALKPKGMCQQSVVKYFGNDNSTAHFSAACGRVYLYPELQIEKSTDRRKDYHKFWNEKAEELRLSPSYDKYSKQELHGIIDSHWRIHAMQICLCDATQEQQLIESLSQEFRGRKLLLSVKTVSKNADLLKEEERKISHLNDELTTLCAGTKTMETKKEKDTNKEKELKKLLTNLKLA